MNRRPSSIFRRAFRPLFVAVVCGALGRAAAVAGEQDPAQVLDAIQQQVQVIFDKCKSSVVRIEAVDGHGYLSGSGFFVDPNGTIFTSYTVGGETDAIQVSFGGISYPAQRVVGDSRSGIAILKIEAQTPFLTFGNSEQLSIASPVIAIGYPMDLELTPVFGTVGGFDLKYQGRYFATRHIRANIPVQRGEGGAPLVNARGEAVGILISRLESGNGSFVLPIEAAEKVRKDFLRFHKVRPGWIGVQVKSLEEPVNSSTAVIEGLIADGPGEKAGLQAGDVIIQVGKRHISSPEDVLNASYFLTAEDETDIRVNRDGSERDFQVTPVDNPDARSRMVGATGETPDSALKLGR
jgi:serine protease Do